MVRGGLIQLAAWGWMILLIVLAFGMVGRKRARAGAFLCTVLQRLSRRPSGR